MAIWVDDRGFDLTFKSMEKAMKSEDIAKKAIKAAVPLLESELKAAVSSAIHTDKSTGDLVNSISATTTLVNNLGVYAVVRPTGHGRTGIRNAEKMAYLEYGTSKGMQPHPIRSKAVASCEPKIVKLMEEIVKKEMGLE